MNDSDDEGPAEITWELLMNSGKHVISASKLVHQFPKLIWYWVKTKLLNSAFPVDYLGTMKGGTSYLAYRPDARKCVADIHLASAITPCFSLLLSV